MTHQAPSKRTKAEKLVREYDANFRRWLQGDLVGAAYDRVQRRLWARAERAGLREEIRAIYRQKREETNG